MITRPYPRRRRFAIVRPMRLALLLLLLVACGEPTDPRARWLQSALVDDNQAVMEREPELTRMKLEKMRRTPYAFFRGTAGIFLRDASQPGFGATRYGSARSSRVLVLGDPHLENIGTFHSASGDLTVEYNDFDGATYGPYYLDVRRLTLSFYVASLQWHLSAEDRRATLREAARGYVAEIERLRRGLEPVRLRERPEHGRIVSDLIRRAARDGNPDDALYKYTELDETLTRRHLKMGVIDPPVDGLVDDELVPVSLEEEALVRGLLRRYPGTLVQPEGTPGYFDVKELARRVGAGVASFPLRRYYVLIEGDLSVADDDRLLELKEIGGGAVYGGVLLYPDRVFRNDAHRVVAAQRAWQEFPDADRLLGWAEDRPMSFRVRNRTAYQQGLSVDRVLRKLDEEDWTIEDVRVLAYGAGRLLARGHALSASLDGEQGLAAIAEALGDDLLGFVAETTAWTVRYGARFEDDYAWFRGLLREDPLLGYRRRSR